MLVVLDPELLHEVFEVTLAEDQEVIQTLSGRIDSVAPTFCAQAFQSWEPPDPPVSPRCPQPRTLRRSLW